jgi:50S ribosomal subunit-associated GTPase HflX
VKRKLNVSINILKEIGAAATPQVVALNKVDLLSKEELERKLEIIRNITDNFVPVSALTGFNIDELAQRVAAALGEQVEVCFTLPNNTDTPSFIHNLYNICDYVQPDYEKNNLKITLRAAPSVMEMLKQRIHKFGGCLLNFKYCAAPSG